MAANSSLKNFGRDGGSCDFLMCCLAEVGGASEWADCGDILHNTCYD